MKSKTTILIGILVVTFAAAILTRFGMQFLGERREHMSTEETGSTGSTGGVSHGSLTSAVSSLSSKMSKPTTTSAPETGVEHFTAQSVPMPVSGGDVSSYQDGSSSTAKPVSLKPYENADDNKLFQYQDSQFTPQCCPSAITNDVGCLCPTEKEKKEWLTRGGNRIGSDADVKV